MTAPPPDGVDCSPVSRCQFCDLPVLSGEIVRVIEGKSYHAPSHCVDRLRARVTELEADARRLLFVREMVDGIGGIDLHEQASIYASALGREESNDDDYLAAIRDAIDAARSAP